MRAFKISSTPAIQKPDFADVSFTHWYKANGETIVPDATPLATLTNFGSGANATQSTALARPIYKTGIINSLPVFRFDGTNTYMQTIGSQLLANDFYMAVVAKCRTLNAYQHLLCFGTDASGQRRGMLLRGDSNILTFNGQAFELDPASPVVIADSVHFFEIVRHGRVISIYQDGVLSAEGEISLNAYAVDTIIIGANNSLGELFNGDLAEILIMSAAPTATEQHVIYDYIATKYAIAISFDLFPVIADVNGLLTTTGAFVDADGKIHIGSLPRLIAFGNQGNTTYAVLGVRGPIYADCSDDSANHIFANRKAGDNVMSIMNRDRLGYSAIRFCDFDFGERGAIGCPNGNSNEFGEGGLGGLFLEASNINDTVNGGRMSFVQTGQIGGLTSKPYLRYRWYSNGDCAFFDLGGAEFMRWFADGTVRGRRMIGDVTTPPTVQVGAGAGTGASATLDANANDDGFIITLVTGSVGTPTANSIQCTVTFGIPFAAAPSKVFSPANAAAALLTGVTALFGAATTTVFTLTSGPTALPNGTTLKFAVK